MIEHAFTLLHQIIDQLKFDAVLIYFGTAGYLFVTLLLVRQWKSGDAIERRGEYAGCKAIAVLAAGLLGVVPASMATSPKHGHGHFLPLILVALTALNLLLWLGIRRRITRMPADNQTEVNQLVPLRLFGLKPAIEVNRWRRHLPTLLVLLVFVVIGEVMYLGNASAKAWQVVTFIMYPVIFIVSMQTASRQEQHRDATGTQANSEQG